MKKRRKVGEPVNSAQRWLASLPPDVRRAHLAECGRKKAVVSTAGNFKPRIYSWAEMRGAALADRPDQI